MKRISQLSPPPAVGREHAERHYMTVHHPFSRRLMRDQGPQIRRYSVDRADWQYSLSGKFDEEPTAWRFVILDVDDDLPDAVGYLPTWVQPLIWTDHAKVIERMSAWEVAPTVVVDRRCGQVTSFSTTVTTTDGRKALIRGSTLSAEARAVVSSEVRMAAIAAQRIPVSSTDPDKAPSVRPEANSACNVHTSTVIALKPASAAAWACPARWGAPGSNRGLRQVVS